MRQARERAPRSAPRSAHDPARWRPRRGTALVLRLVVLFAPVCVCVAASFAFTRLVPAPAAMADRVLWLTAVVLACGLLAWPARRELRRLLPVAALLELSILFPGEAPTRWKVAREAGSVSHLEFLANGVADSEPVRAATTILALVASLARHDRVTRGHSDRVRVFTDMISEELALPRADRDRLRWAALIHDIGKLDVPARLLRKPGKPTTSEWESLRLHPAAGARLVAPLAGWLGEYAAVVIEHHERYDGSGYPSGLRGDQISLGARIVGLADAFEVMTAARPYKKAFSRTTALREVVRCSGTHFDPDVVRALLAVSTPRLRRALGPASWVGQVPVVGTAPVGGLPAVAGAVARGAGGVLITGVASAMVVGVGSGGSAATDGHSSSAQHDAGRPMATHADVPAPTPVLTTASDGSSPGVPSPRLSGPGAPVGSATMTAVPDRASAASGAPGVAAPSVQPAKSAQPAEAATTSAGAGATTQPGGTLQQVANGVGGTVGTVVNGVGGTVTGLLGGGSTSPAPTPAATSAAQTPAPTPSGSGSGSSGVGGLLSKLLGG